MTLSAGQRTALDNLARKQGGEEVDWINIADARTLTELGLAERDRSGWRITPAGLALLKLPSGEGEPGAAPESASEGADVAHPR